MRLWKVKYSDFYNYGAGYSTDIAIGYFCTLGNSLESLHADITKKLGHGHTVKIIQALYIGECSILGAGEFRDGKVLGA